MSNYVSALVAYGVTIRGQTPLFINDVGSLSRSRFFIGCLFMGDSKTILGEVGEKDKANYHFITCRFQGILPENKGDLKSSNTVIYDNCVWI